MASRDGVAMTGKPAFFDPDIYLSVVEMLISSDEVERAFRMLGNMPAYYRDFPPARALEIERSLHRQLFTPTQYAMADRDGHGLDKDTIGQYWPGRAQVLGAKIKELNDQGIKPNLMEIGPGTFWLPYSLRLKKLDFTYEYQSLTHRELDPLPFDKPPEKSGVNIFVAFELIEHLSNENEIFQAYLKFNKDAKHVLLSTPLYTWGGGMKEWRDNALGHLRTYTPKEFMDKAQEMFVGFDWTCVADDTIILCGGRA